MRRRVWLFVLFGVSYICMAYSQTSEVGKQINSIKRDGQYFYAESTLETEEEARASAILMLANFINDYINENKLPLEKKVTEQELANAQILKMKRGSMIRVFAYAKKVNFVPVEEGMTTPASQESLSKIESLEEDTTEELPDANSSELAKKETPVVMVESVAEELPSAPAEEIAVEGGDESLQLSVAWQQTAINDLLANANLKDAMILLNRMKAEYKVKRFGTHSECRNAAMSFWIICESNNNMNLITILGPGANERVNFKTMQYDSLGNYSGKNAIWFEFAK